MRPQRSSRPIGRIVPIALSLHSGVSRSVGCARLPIAGLCPARKPADQSINRNVAPHQHTSDFPPALLACPAARVHSKPKTRTVPAAHALQPALLFAPGAPLDRALGAPDSGPDRPRKLVSHATPRTGVILSPSPGGAVLPDHSAALSDHPRVVQRSRHIDRAQRHEPPPPGTKPCPAMKSTASVLSSPPPPTSIPMPC